MLLIEQSGQLETEQLTGLFIAAFNLQGQCWTNAVAMLSECPHEVKEEINAIFKAFVETAYGIDIAEWCCTYWRNIEEQ